MKRSKILALFALLLSALMLFSACGLGKSKVDLKKVLNPDAKPYNSATVYNDGGEVSALKGATYSKSMSNLALFTKPVKDKADQTQFMVYNMKDNAVVWKETKTAKTEITVDLKNNYFYEDSHGYFTVEVKTKGEDSSAKTSVTTTLYNESGDAIASVDRKETVDSMLDLIYFDGKCYRMNENGGISMAFNYSPLASFPRANTKYENHYYEYGNNHVAVYDDQLNFVAKYTIEKEFEECNCVVLENGNVFIQYNVEADPYSEEYDYLYTDEGDVVKYDLITQILDIKKNSIKEIECDYIVYAFNLKSDSGIYATYSGLKSEKISVAGEAAKIVDKRTTDEAVLVSIDTKGNVSEFGNLNGSPIDGISLFDSNRWFVSTMDGRDYLIGADGAVIGEVTGSEKECGKLFIADGKVYNSSLSVVKDFGAEGWSLYSGGMSGYYYSDMILLEGSAGEFAVCSAAGEINVLIDKDSTDTIVSTNDTYVITKSTSDYKVYNMNGDLLLTVSAKDVISFSSVTTVKGVALLKAEKTSTDSSNLTGTETVYYRLG